VKADEGIMALPQGLNDFALTDKAALVIGAEHPAGRVAAATLAEAGARLMLASQEPGTEEQIKETLKAVHAAGAKTAPIAGVQNAAIRADVRATVDTAVKRLGGLDVMVTALDAPYYALAEAADDTIFDRVMQSNVKSVWMACQEGARAMRQRGGSIVVISSVLAERGVPGASLYCAAKGAVANLVRALALEWARQNIRINLLEAGWMDEEGSPALANDDFAANLLKYLPYKRLVKPEELAGALLYLASPASGFVTGEAVAIDGGLLCRV
jgi:NAD(P)-dependent dehydrogenase (short-subunit alcohol dehydrogenase family)